MKLEIELPPDIEQILQFFKDYFDLNIKKYCEFILIDEVESRKRDLGLN